MHCTRNLAVVSLAMVAALLIGCRKETTSAPGKSGTTGSAAHDHDHDHEAGPHGGHMLELSDGGQGAAHAEWLHDDKAGLVTVFLLEEDGTTAWPDAPAEISIVIRTGKDGDKTYKLTAVETLNDAPVQAAYTLSDPALVTALQVIVDQKEPVLQAMRGDKQYTGTIEAHHHDH
jgi:hypothetical protein